MILPYFNVSFPRNPGAPRASSKKLDLPAFYNEFCTFARKDVTHFEEKPKLRPRGSQGQAKGTPKDDQREPKAIQRETKAP
jgi:hypothetical protein